MRHPACTPVNHLYVVCSGVRTSSYEDGRGPLLWSAQEACRTTLDQVGHPVGSVAGSLGSAGGDSEGAGGSRPPIATKLVDDASKGAVRETISAGYGSAASSGIGPSHRGPMVGRGTNISRRGPAACWQRERPPPSADDERQGRCPTKT